MTFSTINELVGNTKGKISQLNEIVDVLLSGYKTASEVLDSESDRRQPYIDQLLELNQTLSGIVDCHPAVHVNKIWQEATDNMKAIATRNEQICGTIR